MRHIVFTESSSYSVAFLLKPSAFISSDIRKHYIQPLINKGVPEAEVIAFTMKYDETNKASAKLIKEYLDHLLPGLVSLGVKYLYVTDSAYFKVLTGVSKADPNFGYVLPCKIKNFETMHVILGLNYQQLIYNPQLSEKLELSLNTLANKIQGKYQAIGSGILHSAEYPETLQNVAEALQKLHQYPSLTCDIEAFSLRFDEAGIGTIAFAWDQHNGIAFACDYQPLEEMVDGMYGHKVLNEPVRKLLREFFDTYSGELIFHNAAYDVKVLIATL